MNKDTRKLNNVIEIDEGRIREHLGELVRGSVEKTLNAPLDAEADQLCNAARYERTEARQDTRAGRPRFRTFNVIDDFNREGLAIEIDTSLRAARILRTLERLEADRGLPDVMRVDNGPEFLSQLLTDWAKGKGVLIQYIQPGKPNQNAYIERFNRTYRNEVLDLYLFRNLDEVRDITSRWLLEYNEQRPHDALGGLPPVVYTNANAGISTSKLST